MECSERTFGGWQMKVFAMNGLLLGIPASIGPRILYLASEEEPEFNLFGTPDITAETADGTWHIFGGHRLWTSPEATPRSYALDNAPVPISTRGSSITITGNPEVANGVRKFIEISPAGPAAVRVVHRIENISRWPLTFAPWALSVMTTGGFATIPVRRTRVDEAGLLPDRRLTLWPYSSLADNRFVFTDDYIFLKQDTAAAGPVKIGAAARPCWTAYSIGTVTFVKSFAGQDAEYPDFGCTVEVYTNHAMLELETLGALATVPPGGSLRHTETWHLLKTGPLQPSQAEIERILVPNIPAD